jgi:excisionase family DNA binding protein
MQVRRDDQREPLMTVREVAERCRLSVRQIWRHIKQGHLKVVRLGRLVRIRPSDYDRFVNGNWT